MAIFYVDPVDGDDSNTGLSFADRKRSVKSASNTGGSNTEIRVIKTPNTLLSGDSTWVSKINHVPLYLSYLNGQTSSPDPPGWRVYCANHNLSEGDLIFTNGLAEGRLNGWWKISVIDSNFFVIPHLGTVTTTGTSGNRYLWKQQNQLITLDTPKVKNLINCVTGAESGTHITPGFVTNQSTNTSIYNYTTTGLNFDSVTQAWITQFYWSNSFTTGLVSYHAFTNSMDLTGYRQISFHLRQSAGNTTTPNTWKISLCSDANGAVPVYDFLVPAQGGTNYWRSITIDCSNLPAGQTMTTPINSIAFYVVTDYGYHTFRIQNIIACKGPDDPECVNHDSLVSTKRSGDIWWPVYFADEEMGLIIGSRTLESGLGGGNNQAPFCSGYVSPSYASLVHWNFRTNDSVGLLTENNLPCYVVNAPNTHMAALGYDKFPASSGDSQGEQVQHNNTSVIGGWNRTDMSTLDDVTDIGTISWFRVGCNYTGRAFMLQYRDDCTVSNIGVFGGYNGMYINQSQRNTLNNIHFANNYYGIYNYSSNASIFNGLTGTSDLYAIYINNSGALRMKDVTVLSTANALRLVGSYHTSVDGFTSKNLRSTSISLDYWTGHSKFNNISSYGDRYTIRNQFNSNHMIFRNVTATAVGDFSSRYMTDSQSTIFHDQKYKDISVVGTGVPHSVLRPTTYGGGDSVTLDSSAVYYATSYVGKNDPYIHWQNSDGTWVSASGSVFIQKGVGYGSGGQSLSISLAAFDYYAYDSSVLPTSQNGFVAVSDQANGLFSRGIGNKVVLAEVAVIANQVVTFTVQAKRYSYQTGLEHIQANLYVPPTLGNPIVRSPMMTTRDVWEEMSVDVTPIRSGIMVFSMEVFQYYGNTNNQHARRIDVDNIVCTQGN
jgi:hypothetical protein